MTPNEYLKLLKEQNITPNWWCSEEYFQRANFQIAIIGASVRVYESGRQIFPALGLAGAQVKDPEGFWADFPEMQGEDFLDYEYIYDPNCFLKMEGSQWAVFRKNSRKFARRHGEATEYTEYFDPYAEESLLVDWMNRFELIHDAEILIDYFFDGNNKKGLVGVETKKLYGVNIWDENFKYINFRYTICADISFLAEYMRLLFYQDMTCRNKLVNDGGILGNEKLKGFKDKMNPIAIRKVKGNIKKENRN